MWNGLVDRKPALVARCTGAADVLQAVDFARQNDVPISVRSSGHNVTGCAVCDGGLTIDLSPMKGVRVDRSGRRARAAAGVTWGELDHETQAVGLATTGARISTTGIAGVSLGGGYGWLMRSCGLTVDNLVSVDVVTADGRLLTASETEHPDLFWGLRGGGGNFGIATSFEYRLHPVGPLVVGGAAFYPADRAGALLRFYRDFTASAPDELSALFNFLVAPPAPFVPPELHGVPVVAIAVCHTGSAEDARRDLAPLREVGPALLDRIGPMRYTSLQRLYDAAGRFGSLVHGRAGHLAELADELVDALAARAVELTSPLSIAMISPLGGAVARVGDDETAFSHRAAAYDLAIESVWTDPAESERHVRWTEELWSAVRPFTKGVYVNELGEEGEERLREAYAPRTLQRLVALKDVYDPANVFRRNQNIRPSARETHAA